MIRAATAVAAAALLALAGCTSTLDGSPAAGSRAPLSSLPASSGAPSSPTRSQPGTVAFDGLTVSNPTDLSRPPGIRSTSPTAVRSLQAKDLVAGHGTAANPASSVTIQYELVLYKTGAVVNSSWGRGTSPTPFPLSTVIHGLAEGVGGIGTIAPMRTGGRRLIVIPPALGYGSSGAGGQIPPNAPLAVVVDLLGVGTTAPSTSPRQTGCTWTPSGTPARNVAVPPTTDPPHSGVTTVAVDTSRGTMTFRLDRSHAPCAVESFVSLAQQGFFDSTPCRRLTTTGGLYILQCGDPTGSDGGPGYTFQDELSGHERYTRGVIAMANAGPDTNGSQFFLVYRDSNLPPNYTIFGTVSAGLNVVDAVAAKGATPSGDGRPNQSITLRTVRPG